MQISKVNSPDSIPFKMKGKIIRLQPEKKLEWFIADRDFLNSTYQDFQISSAISSLEPQEDLFILKVGLPREESEIIQQGDKFYTQNSYDMFVEIWKNGVQNGKDYYDLSTKNVLLEFCNYMDRFESHPEGPCNKILRFIETLKNK